MLGALRLFHILGHAFCHILRGRRLRNSALHRPIFSSFLPASHKDAIRGFRFRGHSRIPKIRFRFLGNSFYHALKQGIRVLLGEIPEDLDHAGEVHRSFQSHVHADPH